MAARHGQLISGAGGVSAMPANIGGPPPWATEPVELVDADPAWALPGELERDHLETLLARWLTARIEHVGSTSIPGLVAKPIIDLQASVADLSDSDSIAAVLAHLAYLSTYRLISTPEPDMAWGR
jgi:GrpB-like predicted nucleotidyltransferase (UPF0157 family)